MHSITVWKLADRPNYNTHVDKLFPYSEVPYLGEYNLVKIPESLDELIQHVDYWGEGTSGFTDCYNVNHQYQLVSSGSDLDKKIPNRIPVRSYTNCDTSAYIKDDSVINVTVAGGHTDSSCAQDIARIVNKDHGKVVVYGVYTDSQIFSLAVELRKKNLFGYPGATLPNDLKELRNSNGHLVFLSNRAFKDELYNNVLNGNYDSAVNTVKSFGVGNGGELIDEVVMKLISSAPRKVMSYAYKLWHGGAEDVVRNHFPNSFQHIFNEDAVTIINKGYQQPLKLDVHTDSYNDRLAWGDNNQCERTSKRLSWKVIPVWNGNGVTFKLYNNDCNMYLKLDVNVDNIGDRQAWGSTNSNEDRHRYYLEPLVKNGTLVFFIINCQYNQGLKLDVNTDNIGDRRLWGHNGSVYNEYERFRWVIAAW